MTGSDIRPKSWFGPEWTIQSKPMIITVRSVRLIAHDFRGHMAIELYLQYKFRLPVIGFSENIQS
jgi:hypothetical protein